MLGISTPSNGPGTESLPLVEAVQDIFNHKLQGPLGRALRQHLEGGQGQVGLVSRQVLGSS
jgi:hypothetical protein